MYLFFDTETGGLTPDHSLLTLSAILTDREFNIIPAHGFDPGVYVYVKSTNYVTHPKAMEVNNIDLADNDRHGFTVAETQEILRSFIKEACALTGRQRLIPAGHNIPFDMRFLQAHVLPRKEWDTYFVHPPLDTCDVARKLTTQRLISGGCGLPHLCKWFEIDPGIAHTAESDNLATIQVAKRFAALSPRLFRSVNC